MMSLIEQINLLFDNFQDPACRAWDGYNPYWRPNWKEKVEDELDLIREHSPVPLPEDYCELFRRFGGGGIEDQRPNFGSGMILRNLTQRLTFSRIVPTRYPLAMILGILSIFMSVMEMTTGSIWPTNPIFSRRCKNWLGR